MKKDHSLKNNDDMRAKTFISMGFEFVTRNFLHLLPLVTLAALPAIVGHVIDFSKNQDTANTSAMTFAPFEILSFVVSILLSLIVTSYVFHMVRNNLRLPFIEAVEFGLSKAKLLLPVFLLTTLYILGGLILFIIPGLIFGFWYMFSTPLKLDHESLSAKEAMNKSKELFKKHSSHIFSLVLLVLALFIPAVIVTMLISTVIKSVSPLAANISTELILGVLSTIPQVAFTYLYIAISPGPKNAHKK